MRTILIFFVLIPFFMDTAWASGTPVQKNEPKKNSDPINPLIKIKVGQSTIPNACLAPKPAIPKQTKIKPPKKKNQKNKKKPTRFPLPVHYLTPTVLTSPVVKDNADTSKERLDLLKHFLAISDLILPADESVKQGYIAGSQSTRILIRDREEVLVHINHPESKQHSTYKTLFGLFDFFTPKKTTPPTYPPPPAGTLFTIYRQGITLIDPINQESMGILGHRVGTLQLTGIKNDTLWQATITQLLLPIEIGDLLTRFPTINQDFQIHTQTTTPMKGRVLYLRNGLELAGADQVVVVGVGRQNRAVQGLTLPLYREGNKNKDPNTNQTIQQPNTLLGLATLFQIGEKASFALLDDIRQPVKKNDWVSNH